MRDLRVRWALEEAGLAYEEMLIGPEEQRSREYREMQPFGQVPAFEEDGLVLFESGAIVMHIAEGCPALLPIETDARARAKTWMFAALNSVEPQLQMLAELDFFHPKEEAWVKQRRPAVVDRVKLRLGALSERLGSKRHLEGEFTAGDLLMTTVLRILRHTDLLSEYPNLAAYRARCEERPAFERALRAQLAPFEKNAPPPRNS